MMEKHLRNKIRSALFQILREAPEEASSEAETAEAEKPKKARRKSRTSNKGVISTKGAFGSGGRSKKFVADARSRAEDDPKGLMKDLGLSAAVSGGSDLQKALKILNLAIHTNLAMSEAYTGARSSFDIVKGVNEKVAVVAIKLGKLDRKNGVRFLAHTLAAAQNAGYLVLDGGLQFAQGQSASVVIYSN